MRTGLPLVGSFSSSIPAHYYTHMHRFAKYASQFIGIILLISSFAKASDTAYFAQIIAKYGWMFLQYTAPFIIFIELILGLLLIFQQRVRWTSLFCLIFICVLTIIYSYGLFFNKLTDCGCFGHIVLFNNSPTFLYIRNFILCALSFLCYRYGDNHSIIGNGKLGIVFILNIGIILFMSGYTAHFESISSKKHLHIQSLNENPLSNFISVSNDSTYMVFLFSFTCPHCLNSIGNVEQYQRFGLVDKIIGLAPEDNKSERLFRSVFSPTFDIYTFPIDTIMQLSSSFPKAFYIRNDSIISVYEGQIPSAYFSTPITRL